MQTAPVFKQASIRPGNKTMPAPVWCSVVLRAPGEPGSVGGGALEPDRMGSKEKRRIPVSEMEPILSGFLEEEGERGGGQSVAARNTCKTH